MKRVFIVLVTVICIFVLTSAVAFAASIGVFSDEFVPIFNRTSPEKIVNKLDPDAAIFQYGYNTWQATVSVEDISLVKEAFVEKGYTLIDAPVIDGALNPPIVLGAGDRIITLQQTETSVRVVWDECDRDVFSLLVPNESTDTGSVTMVQIGTERGSDVDNPMIGMCYVYKLSDGSAVVVDGGTRSNADNLYNTLKTLDIAKDSDDRYVITAWILTHAHQDHYGTLEVFAEKYSEQADVEYFVHSLPVDKNVITEDECHVEAFIEHINDSFPKITHIVPHAGLKYHFGNLTLEMLYTFETLPLIDYSNDTSLIFVADANGGRVLHMGDAGERAAECTWNQYEPTAFKANAFQVSHHGLTTGISDPHKWDYLEKIYGSTEATIGLLPMGTRYSGDARNGRHNALIEMGAVSGTQTSFLLDNRPTYTNLIANSQAEYDKFIADVEAGISRHETLYGYNGLNMIFSKNGLTTYIMSTETENMATVFDLSDDGIKVVCNELLHKWFESALLDEPEQLCNLLNENK